MLELLPYRAIVIADFEFEFGGHATFEDASRSGERPRPVCMVAKELRTGQEWRLWRGEFGPAPPFPVGPDSLLVAFYASAETRLFPRTWLAQAGEHSRSLRRISRSD
jgi:DNA polymerase-1